MFHKGLWFHHYKKSKYVLWSLWLVALLSGLLMFVHANDVLAQLEAARISNLEFHYLLNLDLETISLLQLLVSIGLPALLVGFSRSNQSLDYIYALPVKREHIYLSKWMLGIVHIIGASTLGLILQLVVVHTTVLSNFLTDGVFWTYYLHQILILCAVFSFSLWLGFIGGSFFAQVAFSVTFLLLPYVLFSLIKMAVSLHYFALGFGAAEMRAYWTVSKAWELFFVNVSFHLKLLSIGQLFRLEFQSRDLSWESIEQLRQTYYGWMSFVTPLLVTLGSVWGVLRMSVTSRNENNGKLLLNIRPRPYFIVGVAVCAFLLGGALVEGMLGYHQYSEDQLPATHWKNLAIYYTAAVISATVAYGVVKRMLGSRLLWRRGR